MNRMQVSSRVSRWLGRAAGSVGVLALGVVPTLAQQTVTLPDLGINASDYTSGMAAKVGPWIAGGLALAVVILAVILGWRKFRAAAA